MFEVFDVVAVAFCVALVLYELVVYTEAHWFVLNVSHKVVWNPIVERVQVNPRMPPRTPRLASLMVWCRYSRRSMIFHQLQARKFPDVKAEFKSWPYFAMGAMGAAMLAVAGLPVLTAVGIGVCGGVLMFASKQGRDLVCFSDDMALLDDEIRNASFHARQLARTRT